MDLISELCLHLHNVEYQFCTNVKFSTNSLAQLFPTANILQPAVCERFQTATATKTKAYEMQRSTFFQENGQNNAQIIHS